MKKIFDIKFSKKYILLFCVFVMIIFFEPQSFKLDDFSYLITIDKIYKYLKLFLGTILILYYFYNFKPSKIFILMFLFQLIAGISTIAFKGDFFRYFGPAFTTMIMIAISEILVKNNLIIVFSKKIVLYFRIIVLINIFSIILVDFFPNISNYFTYFLGIDNRWIFTYIPWIFFEFLLFYVNKNNKNFIYVMSAISISEITLLYKWSAAAMIIFILWFVLFFPNFFEKIGKKMIYFYGIIMTNILLVIFKIQYLFEPFLRIIGKDPTISGRTFLWDKIIVDFPKYWYLGHGMQSIEFDKLYFGSSSLNYNLTFLRVIHAHNTFMTIIYRFGIFDLILYIIIIFYSLNKAIKSKNNLSNILIISMIICLILGLFDTIDLCAVYFIIGFCGVIDLFNYKEEYKNEKLFKEKI